MKNRLSLASAAMLIAMLVSFVPLAGATVQPAAASTYCDAAQFMADVTYADGSVLAPNTAFKKTWQLKNVGTCTWTTSYSLVYVSGEKMGTNLSAPMPNSVAPGESVKVSVDMTSPASAAKYRGNWQLKNAAGVLFGIGYNANGLFWVEIVVSGGGTTGVVYNFADKACDAAWTSGAGTLPCPGTDGDSKGFVLKQANPKLENGVADSNPGLLISPQAVNNGYIRGEYPAFRVQNGDQFQATVSCEYGATSCYVSYRLDYQVVNGTSGTLSPFPFREKYEGQYYRAKVDLSRFAGQDVKFILYTDAYGSPTGDRAFWANPIILRQGSTITPVPTTPSPNSGCDKAEFKREGETIPDGTTFAPGATFKKTWRLKNIGTCTWTTDYLLAFSSGELMGATTTAKLSNSVAPGQTVDLTLPMTAPNAGGTFTGYWSLKNASGQVFGINTGSHQPFFWVTIKVTGPTATPSIIPTGPTPTQQAGTAYDFVTEMCKATWVSGGANPLPCPGTDGDAKGFVLKIDNPKLENGTTDARPGLLTNPQATTNGYIKGTYPAFRVQQGDHFKTIVNCQYGATSCFVTFRLDYLVGSDTTVQHLWTFGEKYEGKYFEYDKDLGFLAGKDIQFILTVTVGTATSGQRALWVAPRIYRAGAATGATATFTPTATATTDPMSGWGVYTNTKYNFRFKTPPGSVNGTITDNATRIFLPFTLGTLLVEKYTDVKVVENATACTYGTSPAGTSETVTINGSQFLKETGSEGAAGSIYEWVAYSAFKPATTTCVTVNFVLHSTNTGILPTPEPPPYNKTAESAVFDTIMNTFTWIQ